jgi:hypothetical protein
MSTPQLTCPSCSSRFKGPDSLHDGDRFKCPKCGAKFRIVAAAGRPVAQRPARPKVEEVQEVEAIEEEAIDELEVLDEGEAGPQRMKEKQRMKLAYRGLGLQYVKFLLVIVGLLFAGLFMIARSIMPDFLITVLSIPVSSATPLIGLTGSLLCCWVPKRSQARLLVQVSFGLDIGAIAASGLGNILSLAGGHLAIAGASLAAMGAFASLAACILFMLFLRALAAYLKDRGTEEEIMEIMVRWIVMTVGGPVLLFPLGALSAPIRRSVVGGVFSLVLLGGIYVTFLVFYFRTVLRLLNVISAIRQKIDSRYDLD